MPEAGLGATAAAELEQEGTRDADRAGAEIIMLESEGIPESVGGLRGRQTTKNDRLPHPDQPH